MPTTHPGVTGRSDLEPLSVSPRQACLLLGVGTTRLYQIIRDGELSTYHEGRARRITMRSIRERIARLTAITESQAPVPRHRGRPRKNANTAAST
jgi:excisionase family DNA binding protein